MEICNPPLSFPTPVIEGSPNPSASLQSTMWSHFRLCWWVGKYCSVLCREFRVVWVAFLRWMCSNRGSRRPRGGVFGKSQTCVNSSGSSTLLVGRTVVGGSLGSGSGNSLVNGTGSLGRSVGRSVGRVIRTVSYCARIATPIKSYLVKLLPSFCSSF